MKVGWLTMSDIRDDSDIDFIMADGVMTIEWSTSSEWVLVTGGCDGAIRFWDIRRAGCFRVLDQSQSQLGRRPPLLERSALSKVHDIDNLMFTPLSSVFFNFE